MTKWRISNFRCLSLPAGNHQVAQPPALTQPMSAQAPGWPSICICKMYLCICICICICFCICVCFWHLHLEIPYIWTHVSGCLDQLLSAHLAQSENNNYYINHNSNSNNNNNNINNNYKLWRQPVTSLHLPIHLQQQNTKIQNRSLPPPSLPFSLPPPQPLTWEEQTDSAQSFLRLLLCFPIKLNNLHLTSTPPHPRHDFEMEVTPWQENLPQKRVLMVSAEKKQKSGLMVSREKKRRNGFRVKTENQFLSLLHPLPLPRWAFHLGIFLLQSYQQIHFKIETNTSKTKTNLSQNEKAISQLVAPLASSSLSSELHTFEQIHFKNEKNIFQN